MNVRRTHTFALLELSGPAFEEVKGKLTAAGYSHAFTEVDGKPVIDMHGIAVVAEEAKAKPAGPDLLCDCGHAESEHHTHEFQDGYCGACSCARFQVAV